MVSSAHQPAGMLDSGSYMSTSRQGSRKGDLRAVGEVAELGLPQDERVGVLQRVAQLKAEDAKLGQRAVADRELAVLLAAEHVRERRVRLPGHLRRRAPQKLMGGTSVVHSPTFTLCLGALRNYQPPFQHARALYDRCMVVLWHEHMHA